MEQKPKKREWVKNAAIIFLAVMLVLTFFSNTILNRTLPEVVTRYVEPNSIDSKVRISGTVSARENYDVILDQTRKVAAVNVKLGQAVSTGDVLFTLESGDSEELENAKKQLEQDKRDYQRFLVGLSSSDYTSDNREISLAREDLNKAIEKRDALPVPTAEAMAAAAEAVERAQAAVDRAAAVIKQYELDLKKAELGKKESTDGSDPKVPEELRKAITDAEDAKAAARVTLNAALLAYGEDYTKLKLAALEAIEKDKEKNGSKSRFDSLEDDEKVFLVEVFEEQFFLRIAGYDEDLRASSNGFETAKRVLDREEGRAITLLEVDKTNNNRKTEQACRARERQLVSGYADTLRMMPYYLENASVYNISADTEMTYAYQKINSAKEAYSGAEESIRTAEDNQRTWMAEHPAEDAKKYEGRSHAYWEKEADRLGLLIDEASLEKDELQAALDKATEAEGTLKQQQTALETTNEEVDRLQRALEDKLFALSQRQKEDGKTQQLNALSIQEWQEKLAEAEKKIEELSGNEFSEVKSKVNGTVASLSVSAGHKAEAGATLATIEVEDLGYTMTATVSVDQARLLHVGDSANVSNYYWGSQTTAVLSGMQPDPKDPRSSRVLTFDLAGDVNAGDQLSFSIGERNASYDLVVPNSALRSDTNGSFVLMITAKNSPLGNRYFATRVDVEVVASDDYNTAVKGALSNMDSVITTSSGNAPVKNGDQVRLADMNNG